MLWPEDFIKQVGVEPYYKDGHGVIYCAECMDVMRDMPDNCVDTVITDPPYGLKFMGKDWDHGIPGVRFWREILRVAKPGAMCLAFGGSRTYHRLVCAIEDAGWEIRDCIMWIYGSGFPKSLDISKAIDKAAGAEREMVGINPNFCENRIDSIGTDNGIYGGAGPDKGKFITAPSTDAAKLWDGWGTALKPAYEPICVAMKPLDGTFAQNALKHGVAGLNIDGGRIEVDKRDHIMKYPYSESKYKSKYKGGSSYKFSNIVSANPQGRWPANVIHDGSEEVVRLFPAAGNNWKRNYGEEDYRGRQYKGGIFGGGGYQGGSTYSDSGSAARFFYCAKASKAERGENNNHPTVKPLALIQYLCKLTKTPTGGVILDPFSGSGTVGVVAKRLQRKYVLIDLNAEYNKIAEDRLRQCEMQLR